MKSAKSAAVASEAFTNAGAFTSLLNAAGIFVVYNSNDVSNVAYLPLLSLIVNV